MMESFKNVNERALELLYAFSNFTVPPEQLLANEEVFLKFVKAITNLMKKQLCLVENISC